VSKMIWNVDETIEHLSKYFELVPGDLISPAPGRRARWCPATCWRAASTVSARCAVKVAPPARAEVRQPFGEVEPMMRLHSAARSSASFRVRIALQLKGLPYEYVPVDLVHGDQFRESFRGLNRPSWCRCWSTTARC